MTTVVVKDSAGLVAALKSAASGDVIQLAAGEYSPIALRGVNINGEVTITSQDPNAPAVLNGLTVRDCAGLTFRELEFKVDPAKADYPFLVFGSKNVVLDNLHVHGTLDGDESNDIAALMIRESTNVSVTNSEFEQLRHGVAHIDCEQLTIADNYFHDIRTDGVRGGGSSDVTISGNYFTNFHMAEGDHADAIQFWTTNTTEPASDIVVSGNVIVRGNGDPIQGIFFRDQVGNLEFQNVRITDNLVVGGTYNGISVNGGRGVVISGNTVVEIPNQASRIHIDDATEVTLTSNVATQYLLDGARFVANSGNSTIVAPSDGGKLIQQQWLSNHLATADATASSAKFASFSEPSAVLNVSALTSTVLDQAAEAAIRAMEATRAEAVTLTGTAGADDLKADAKRDTTIHAGDGNDILRGDGVGHNTLMGGGGNDSYFVSASSNTVVERANEGLDMVSSSIDFVLPDNVEQLRLTGGARVGVGNGLDNKITGSAGDDELRGHGGNDALFGLEGGDRLIGGDGNDTLTGAGGVDTLSGDGGADKLVGGEGSDSLSGGAGVDVLEAGEGADSMSGGLGGDTFLFRSGDVTTTPDVITDFSRADGDVISLQAIDANTAVGGDQRFAFIGTQAFGRVAGQLRYEVKGSEIKVYGDVNGDAVADFQIVVTGSGTLQGSDFLL